MQCHLVVTAENSPKVTLRWPPAGGAKTSGGLDGFLEELCLGRVARAGNGDTTSDRIFLCLKGDELVARRDVADLENLVRRIREHGWGSPVYLVASSSILTPVLREGWASVVTWLRAGVQTGLHAFLSVPYDRYGTGPQEETLDNAVARSKQRSACLAALRSHGLKWRCFGDRDRPLYAELFQPWSSDGSSLDRGEHLVVLVDGAKAESQTAIVEKALAAFPRRNHLVTTLRREATQELRNLCERRELFGPFRFESELEVLFFLLRLADPREMDEALGGLGLRLIRCEIAPTFAASSMGQPCLLFTNSFDVEEAKHCRAASKDVAEVLGMLPWGVSFHLEPAITLDRLESLLGRKDRPDFTTWIHMGHGTDEGSLIESDAFTDRTPDEWLACFSGHGLNLEVAAFLTCYSWQIARRFAASGVGVAVGYEGVVHTQEARKTAVWIARRLASHGFERHAILSGFHAAAAHLAVSGKALSPPVAYASLRR
jgi:hypothetical protein